MLTSTTELANKTRHLLTDLTAEVATINSTQAENVVAINRTAEEVIAPAPEPMSGFAPESAPTPAPALAQVMINKKRIEEQKFHIQRSEKMISHLQFGMVCTILSSPLLLLLLLLLPLLYPGFRRMFRKDFTMTRLPWMMPRKLSTT